MDKPALTESRLAEINSLTAEVAAGRIRVRFDEETAWLAILDLRRDNERLRAREAALLEVVRTVAEANVICNHYFDILDGYPYPPEHVDYLCPTVGHPKASTVRAQARALLAVSEPPATSKPTHLVSVSDLASMDLRHCNVEATCACGNPVAGMFIQDTYDREEVSEFFASAYRVHQSWCPSAHTLSLKVHELPERSTKLASDSADEAK